jgi:hypothetical protein
MLRILEVPEISRGSHPGLFTGLEVIADEFESGWSVIVTPGNDVFLEIEVKAPSGQTRKRLLKDQTASGVQTVMRRLQQEAQEIERLLDAALAAHK